MNKVLQRALLITSISFALGITGCNSAQNTHEEHQHEHSHEAGSEHNQAGTTAPKQDQIQKAFQDELNGLTTVEQDIKKGDYQNASLIADQLHEEFHAVILPPLTEKKGKEYAEDIHGKYDELQDAIKQKNKANITQLVKVNRDNLQTVADILGISLKK